jgi:uncharacterized protein YgiM (DUF1202 family)
MSKYLLLTVVLLLASCANIRPMTETASPPPQTQTTVVKTSLDIKTSTPAPGGEIEVGVVVVESLNMREGPGTSFPAVGTLHQGEKFQILGERINSTNNKWLLISFANNSFAWVIGDQTYVTIQKETVDFTTYSTWQKNVESGKAVLAEFSATP